MKASTIKKSMTKTILTLGIALSIFMYNSTFALAAVCNGSSDGVHHFEQHLEESAGHLKTGGTHRYLYGYDSQKKPIYKDDCKLTYYYKYCNIVCRFCGTKQDGTRHDHLSSTMHSVSHR